ncbi:MAG: heparinase II/III family protein [Phycisphaeraceae bacterium]
MARSTETEIALDRSDKAESTRFSANAPAPGLFVNPGCWAELRKKLSDPFFARLLERSRAKLDAFIDASEGLSDDHRLWKGLVQQGAVTWHLTGEQRYRDLAIRTLMHGCTAPWSPSARHRQVGLNHADLGTGEMMYTTSFGLDALFDDLSVQQRRTCVDALIHNGLERYFAGIRAKEWWVECDFNWNSALHGNAGIAALAIRHHAPNLSSRTLATARKGLKFMIDAYPEGGGWTEGIMYLATATVHLTDFAFALHRITGDDLGVLVNRNLHDSIDFALTMHGGDGLPYNLSDMNVRHRTSKAGRGRGWAASYVFWYADHLNRPDWTADQSDKIDAGALGQLSALFSSIDSFWFRRAHQPAKPRTIAGGVHHFRGLDWLTWRGNTSWLALRAGNNGGNHNHRDLGQIIFGLDDTRFLIDPGYGATATSMHNCPTVRRSDQVDGATARITNLQSFDRGFKLVVDISEAFPFVLEHYHRHVAVVDDEHLILIDDIQGAGQRNDMFGHFQTNLPAEITNEGFAIHGEDATLRVWFGSNLAEKQILPWNNDGQVFNCLRWRDAHLRVHTVQPIVLTRSSAPITAAKTKDSVEFTIGRCQLSVPLRAR